MLMPTIARFSGIVIRMNPKGKEHNPPHVHVQYDNYEITFDIVNMISRGWWFLKKQFKQSEKFIRSHAQELIEMWDTQNFRLIESKEE